MLFKLDVLKEKSKQRRVILGKNLILLMNKKIMWLRTIIFFTCKSWFQKQQNKLWYQHTKLLFWVGFTRMNCFLQWNKSQSVSLRNSIFFHPKTIFNWHVNGVGNCPVSPETFPKEKAAKVDSKKENSFFYFIQNWNENKSLIWQRIWTMKTVSSSQTQSF